MEDFKTSLHTAHQMTEGLQNLVISLAEQRDETFLVQNHSRDASIDWWMKQREREIVKKGS